MTLMLVPPRLLLTLLSPWITPVPAAVPQTPAAVVASYDVADGSHAAIAQANSKPAPSNPYAKPEPAYAPWGRLAVQLVQKRYPAAALVDYLHVGRTHPAQGQSAETFKLWLRQGTREFGVFVTITFDDNTQRVQSVTYRETTR